MGLFLASSLGNKVYIKVFVFILFLVLEVWPYTYYIFLVDFDPIESLALQMKQKEAQRICKRMVIESNWEAESCHVFILNIVLKCFEYQYPGDHQVIIETQKYKNKCNTKYLIDSRGLFFFVNLLTIKQLIPTLLIYLWASK